MKCYENLSLWLFFFSFILKWCSYIPLQYNNFTLYNSYNFGHLVTIHTHTRIIAYTLSLTQALSHTFTLSFDYLTTPTVQGTYVQYYVFLLLWYLLLHPFIMLNVIAFLSRYVSHISNIYFSQFIPDWKRKRILI